MTHPESESLRELAAAYALGALGPEETRAFEELLGRSPEIQRDVAEYREVAALLGLGAGEGVPSAELRARVLASPVRTRDTSTPRQGLRSPLRWLAVAAGLAALTIMGERIVSLGKEVRQRDAVLAQRDSALSSQQQQLAERQALLDAVLDPEVRLFQLTSSGDPEPGVQLFWNQRRNQAIVNAYRLKPVPPGRAYQLWFIQNGKPVPSVTFTPKNGAARLIGIPVPPGGKPSAAAITVEPSSGSAQPTSPIVLSGPLDRS
jgi:anti-sigma-K factor RskA